MNSSQLSSMAAKGRGGGGGGGGSKSLNFNVGILGHIDSGKTSLGMQYVYTSLLVYITLL